jgi:hypothetical protein
MIAVQSVVIVGLIAALINTALRERPAYVMALAPDGQEYVVSTPRKAISLRDLVIYNGVKQDLRDWAEAYYERSLTTAAKDVAKARWYMTDPVAERFVIDAIGQHGWQAKLHGGQAQEEHIHVDNVILRDADVQTPPYRGQILFTKTTPGRAPEHWRSEITFVVSPEAVKGPLPLYNALGVFLVKTPEESQDYLKP